ncbi:MAG: universal stress protein [Halobacteriaceae archaeon]
MTFLVPFDGSRLAVTALDRASEFGADRDEGVVALTVVPEDAEYARERGWLGSEETFDVDRVASRLSQQVADRAPDATFRYVTVTASDPVASTTLEIVRAIREVAVEVDATVLFIGSENAGRVSTPVTSVGSPISEDPQYDVHIVRHPA